MKTKNRYNNSDNQWSPSTGTSGAACPPGSIPQTERAPYSGPQVRLFLKLVVTLLDGTVCDLWGIVYLWWARHYWEKRVVVSFPQMIMKLPALRGFLRLEVPVRVCVRPFPQEGSVSPFGYRTHFHTQLSLLEPGEEKNRRISQSSFQEVSDKMHVKQRQSSTLCALKENCYFCLPHCGLLWLSNFLGIRDVTQQFDCLIMFIEFACPLWA